MEHSNQALLAGVIASQLLVSQPVLFCCKCILRFQIARNGMFVAPSPMMILRISGFCTPCFRKPYRVYGDCSVRVFCPILLNFLSVLLPGQNLRDLVAAICNAVFGSRSYFVVFVCQFSWCFAAIVVTSFWSVCAAFVYKIHTCGPLGHLYWLFASLPLVCVFW